MNDESSADQNIETATLLQKTPSFISTPQVLVVDEGDTVRLPCSVDRLEGFVMLWKKQNDILTVASQIIETVEKLSGVGHKLIRTLFSDLVVVQRI